MEPNTLFLAFHSGALPNWDPSAQLSERLTFLRVYVPDTTLSLSSSCPFKSNIISFFLGEEIKAPISLENVILLV